MHSNLKEKSLQENVQRKLPQNVTYWESLLHKLIKIPDLNYDRPIVKARHIKITANEHACGSMRR